MANNGTLMQYFEWYLPSDCTLWKQLAQQAEDLSKTGVTAVWAPPAYKGQAGVNDVGYGVYDHYDLGEFDQKGTVPTKYGTKDEFINAVNSLHKNNVQVYADIVLNQMMGADGTEQVTAYEVNPSNRCEIISGEEQISAWTSFVYPARNKQYSDFCWNASHFDGIDWDEQSKRSAIFLFKGKSWQQEVDNENCNFDYLMGADLDFANPQVVNHLNEWGEWFIKTTDVDGVRLDAVKHIEGEFYDTWLPNMRIATGKELFAVGEYWNGSKSSLENYLSEVKGDMSLFDVPLHYNFFNAANQGESYDMRHIFDNTLVSENPTKAVTFVGNHDTQPGQALQSFVSGWFRPIAYSLILLQQSGYPCVFYGDYYGIPHDNIQPCEHLKQLISLRKNYAYGEQASYFDNEHIIGFTRMGDQEHEKSGCAVLVNNSTSGSKYMFVGKDKAGKSYYDAINDNKQHVVIDESGCGTFEVPGGGIAVYVQE